jgi:DNA-binding transcriptional regulator YiaG
MATIPTPEEIFELRTRLGISQAAAADLVHCSAIAWGQWERATRKMNAAAWELFTIKAAAMLAKRVKQPRVGS